MSMETPKLPVKADQKYNPEEVQDMVQDIIDKYNDSLMYTKGDIMATLTGVLFEINEVYNFPIPVCAIIEQFSVRLREGVKNDRL